MNTQTPYRSPDTYRVLVVLVNNRRDWEIVQTQGWYRIPVSRAPRQVGADLLAFYFSKVFADMAWSVRYVAPVLRFELARRRELLPEEADHPRADDWYYRVVLGPPEPLPRPIPSKRLRRLVFLPTTLGRLLSAEEINDLWIREPLEERVWQALKGAGLRPEASFEVKDSGMRYEITIAIPCVEGGVGVGLAERVPVPPGWTYVSAASAGKDVTDVVARVLAEVERRGGAWA